MRQSLKNIQVFLLALALSILFLNAQAQGTDNLYGGKEGGIVGRIASQHDVTQNGQFTYEMPNRTICDPWGKRLTSNGFDATLISKYLI